MYSSVDVNVGWLFPVSGSETTFGTLSLCFPNDVEISGNVSHFDCAIDFFGTVFCNYPCEILAILVTFNRQGIAHNTYSPVTYVDFYNETMKMKWEMAVYVRIDKHCNETMHRTFLKSIGGQSVFKCLQHKTWLIQKHVTDNVHCYETSCRAKVKWTCPFSDCSTAVCQSHFSNSENAESIKFIISTHDQPHEIDCCTNVKLVLQQMNSFASNLHATIMARKPWALLCAAFFPSADGIDASLLELQSQLLRVAKENQVLSPRFLCQKFQNEASINTHFYDSVHFVSFIET